MSCVQASGVRHDHHPCRIHSSRSRDDRTRSVYSQSSATQTSRGVALSRRAPSAVLPFRRIRAASALARSTTRRPARRFPRVQRAYRCFHSGSRTCGTGGLDQFYCELSLSAGSPSGAELTPPNFHSNPDGFDLLKYCISFEEPDGNRPVCIENRIRYRFIRVRLQFYRFWPASEMQPNRFASRQIEDTRT
jgi:hypothetical protein